MSKDSDNGIAGKLGIIALVCCIGIFIIALVGGMTSSDKTTSAFNENDKNQSNITETDNPSDNCHEMNGTIVAKDVSGKSIDYLIDINGTIYYLSCHYQPFEEFYVGDKVTMNGTIMDSHEHLYSSDFDGKYEGEYPTISLSFIVENQHTYGQMRLTSDVDNKYYKQVDTLQV